MKPCFVSFLDIDHFPERKYVVIDMDTPIRIQRARLDFAALDSEKKELEWGELIGSSSPSMTPPPAPQPHSVDSLIAKIDAKIAALEAEEARDKKGVTPGDKTSHTEGDESIPTFDIDKLLTGISTESTTSDEKSSQMSSLMDAIMKRKDSIDISNEE